MTLRFTNGELLEHEEKLTSAMLAGDAGTLDELLAQDVSFVGPDGSTWTREFEIEGYGGGRISLDSYDVKSLQARVYGSTGVTCSLAVLKGTAGSNPFEMRLRYTRTWVGLASGWRVIAAHASTTTDDD